MNTIQHYFRKVTLVPLVMTIGALSVLAVLTQSLSTIDLIVENRQSAWTFLSITLLTVPQLIAIIMPLALFMASIFALNRLNLDSELVVAKAAGYSPWQLTSPVLRVAVYALIVHLLINLFAQPFAQREMRESMLGVRSDLAAQLVRPGKFNVPTKNVTVYTSEILPSGKMGDVLIYDARDVENPTTYTAKHGSISSSKGSATLVMNDGYVQHSNPERNINVIGFDEYQFDLSEIMTTDARLSLKASDQYLHELFFPDKSRSNYDVMKPRYLAEGHMRLSTPFYNIALVLIAICFLVRGEFQRMGYGKRIASAASLGFFIRLLGFVIASAAEENTALNWVQYGIPLLTICICVWFISRKKRSRPLFKKRPPPLTSKKITS